MIGKYTNLTSGQFLSSLKCTLIRLKCKNVNKIHEIKSRVQKVIIRRFYSETKEMKNIP